MLLSELRALKREKRRNSLLERVGDEGSSDEEGDDEDEEKEIHKCYDDDSTDSAVDDPKFCVKSRRAL